MKLQFNLSERITAAMAAILFGLAFALHANAADPAKYASSSVLAQGKWVRVQINTPGLQTITATSLKNFGFSDPSKVNVYGYGGQMIPEALRPDLADDLPMVPVHRQPSGNISFFATGNISWSPNSVASGMSYSHTINPYAETSYYFLSDRLPNGKEPEELDLSDIGDLPKANLFTEHLVHENDLIQCATSGRDYLGEDFRTSKLQMFTFDLSGNVGETANLRVRFGANTSGSGSSIFVLADGEQLPSTTSDKIDAVKQSSDFYKVTTTTKTAPVSGDKLVVGIQYNAGGVVSTARLDWIEVEYTRSLAMKDSKLHFNVSTSSPTAYVISGATENTVVWDVTDPGDVKVVKGLFNASDKSLTLAQTETGYREFFAFDPSAKGAQPTGRGKIANQDIHSLPVPDMVIVSPEEYMAAANRIANLHRTHDGMTVHVLQPEKIYNEFSSGSPDASAIRKMLKMWHDRSLAADSLNQLRYCLIMSRPTYDNKIKNQDTRNAGYPRVPIWQSKDLYTESSSYCTDDFMGMLEDESSARAMHQRTIDVTVARYPVTSPAEANIAAEKLEQYVNGIQYGPWRNNIMVIADDDDNGAHLEQAQSSISLMQADGAGEHFAFERLYLDAFERKKTGTGNEFPDAKARMLKKWEKEGVAFINYIGHANPKEWGHEKLLTWNDMNTMSNQSLPVLYAATCSFGQWDAESTSGAEVMLLNPAGGAIALITPSRSVYISKNGELTNEMSRQAFKKDSDGLPQRLGDIIRNAKNDIKKSDANANRYHFFGDPALRMPGATYTIVIDSLAGAPLQADVAESPVIGARATVALKGRVVNPMGETIPFNGPLQFTLFDAETSVETHGWGDNGKVCVYQDRPNKLATGGTTVTDGAWEASILMPSEIANNYSPALLTLYAYSQELGMEANGSTDHLFVYGYDENSLTDEDGPVIESFSINNGSDTHIVHQNPVVTAAFTDESGINISDAGLGHKMSLTLDSKKTFEDVNNYYTPDPYDNGGGSIAYPLQGLEPGEHELKLTVWDNANNSSSASLTFTVGLNLRPQIFDLQTIYNRNEDRFTFNISTDRTLCRIECTYECRALDGSLIWTDTRSAYSGKDSSASYSWDLKDANGHRVPRGIYVIRATVKGDDGLSTTQNKKIAVPAP